MGRLWRLARQHATIQLGSFRSAHYLGFMDIPFDPLALENAQDFIAKAFSLLARGVADRRSAFHMISLATIGLDGSPQLRTVVLRGFDRTAPSLVFHTDRRAAKYAELSNLPHAAALAYDPGAKLQIRMEGTAAIISGGGAAEIWARLQPTSRLCYHTPDAPGGTLGGDSPLTEAQARSNFCVCTLTISKLDVLYLRAAGHLRAQARFTQAGTSAAWVAP
jgi:hypothetical protein